MRLKKSKTYNLKRRDIIIEFCYLSVNRFLCHLSVDFWTFDFALRFVLSIGRIKQLTGGFCETRNPTFPCPSIIFFHLPWTAHFPQSSSVFSSTRGGAGGGCGKAPRGAPVAVAAAPSSEHGRSLPRQAMGGLCRSE